MSSTVKHIVEQLDIMAYLNVLSFSALSGSGTTISPSLHDLDAIEELCKDMPPNQRPYNVFFMNSLYTRNMPIYAKEIENPFNFEAYQWSDKKRKEQIDAEVMAYSIISCCSLIERLLTNRIQLENAQFIAFLLFKNAYHQARFIKHYLKIGDLYYCGEDISDNNKEVHIQITSKEPDSLSQLYVLQAFEALKRIDSYNISFMHIKEDEFEEDLELLYPLYASIVEYMPEIKSRDLANLGLCIAEIYVKNEAPCENAYMTLNSIGAELLKRLGPNGEMGRTCTDLEESSPITSFNVLNLLSQLYYMFDNKAYHKACSKLYNKLHSMWDKEHCTFKLKDSNKQSYSVKDVSAIIAALISFYCISSSDGLKEQLEGQIKGAYDMAFIKSQIYMGQARPILQQCIMELPPDIEPVEGYAPVFNKAFEYKISKDKFYCDADVFRADYVLSACCMLLSNFSIYCI